MSSLLKKAASFSPAQKLRRNIGLLEAGSCRADRAAECLSSLRLLVALLNHLNALSWCFWMDPTSNQVNASRVAI